MRLFHFLDIQPLRNKREGLNSLNLFHFIFYPFFDYSFFITDSAFLYCISFVYLALFFVVHGALAWGHEMFCVLFAIIFFLFLHLILVLHPLTFIFFFVFYFYSYTICCFAQNTISSAYSFLLLIRYSRYQLHFSSIVFF